MDVVGLCRGAREASRVVSTASTEVKNRVLKELADALLARRREIVAANQRDCAAAETAHLPSAKLRRLALNEQNIAQLCEGLRQIAALPDPVGQVVREYQPASGMRVRRVRSPLGVVCMIYEARPGVTIDAFALCFKAGNACILKGGKEAAESNALLGAIARGVLERNGLPPAAITVFDSSDREQLRALLQQTDWVDLVIPRGGEDLIRWVAEHSRIPTVQHYKGVCHIYVDDSADLDLAEKVCLTAKTSAPATCNAAECVLVHGSAARAFVPRMVKAWHAAGVEVRGDEDVCHLALEAKAAHAEDWGREFLDLIIAVRVVANMDEAIELIHKHTSNHTESILTRDAENAERFCREVQSSCVLVNASTRMNDGFSLGLGAEIGISTSKIHAYGPMGLEELTTARFVCEGNGQVR